MSTTNTNELLLLAAKAIGATEYGGIDDCRPPGIVLLNGVPTHYEGHGEFGYAWNPLEDDGDALRLAFALGIDILHRGSSVRAVARNAEGEVIEVCDIGRVAGEAGLRRVIVMAAAWIGKAMP